MLATPNNLYRASTATSVANSGLGLNAMTKPAGTEVASIQPGVKYSTYIPGAASFVTDFNADVGNYTIYLYAKPNDGNVLTVAGNTLTYADNTFKVVNDIGESLSIPFDSHRAHLIVFTYSDLEAGVYVDGHGGVLSADTTDISGPLTVTLLESGGILGDVQAMTGVISTKDMKSLVSDYLYPVTQADDAIVMSDSERDYAYVVNLPDESFTTGEIRTVMLEAPEIMAFKFEYVLDGEADVYLNGYTAHSGIVLDELPDEFSVVSHGPSTMSKIRVTYYDSAFVTTGIADISTDKSTGTPAPIHLHDDNAGTTGVTTVSLNEPVNTVAGWFRVEDGTVLPGVSMSSGVLTGTGLYVNGKAYAGQALNGWYFLVKAGAVTGSFETSVPVHSYYLDDVALNATQIDDLYEMFFGSPVHTTSAETIGLVEEAAMVISSEWSIVASG